MRDENRKVIPFHVLTFAICLPFYLIISTGPEEYYLPSIMVLMWAPGIAAILVKLVYGLLWMTGLGDLAFERLGDDAPMKILTAAAAFFLWRKKDRTRNAV